MDKILEAAMLEKGDLLIIRIDADYGKNIDEIIEVINKHLKGKDIDCLIIPKTMSFDKVDDQILKKVGLQKIRE